MRRIQVLFALMFFSGFVHAQPLRIAVSESFLSLPLFVAEAEGLFQKRGVDVTLIKCVGGNRCLRNMLQGASDLSTATELPVVFNSFTRSDFSILASFVNSSRDLKVLTKSSRNIRTPENLRGKTLGFFPGSASQYLLDLVLVYSGIDPSNITFREITPETALSSLAKGEVDALCMWEPYASLIQHQLGAEVQLLPIPKLYTETFNLIAMKPVIQKQPRELERVMFALKDSTEFINKNPAKAKALLASRLNISSKIVEEIFDDYRFRLSLNRSLSRTMEGQARWALREGHVDSESIQPNYSDYLYSPILKLVDPGAVSLP